VARRVAATYVERGLVQAAIRVLVAAGGDDDAASTLAALPQRQVSRMDVRELRSLLATITPAALDRHPRGWLHLARACEAAAEKTLRTDALERARRQADGDPVLQREIEAELARDLVRDGAVEAAAGAAERLLAAAGADEVQTRVRALHVLGRTHAWRGGEDGLAAAEPLLREAAELYGQLGLATHRAHALLALAYDVLTLGGRTAEAVDVLGEALAGLPGRARLRGVLLVFQAEALIDLGRLQEAEASLVAAERLGTLLGDARTLGYVAWLRARSAALVGDRERVRLEVAEAERHPGEWFAHHSGVEFLAEAAALLDQSGLADEALGRLERARQRRAEAPRYVLLAEGGIEARRGDAARAEQLLAEVAGDSSLEVREQWRVALLRAFAAHRLGEPERCAAFARLAHDLVAQSGSPALMERREPEVTEALRRAGVLPELEPTGAEKGAIASVVLLGSFAIRGTAGELQLPAGRPTSLVKLLAARGPRLKVEQALEWLWPEVDVVSGRKRLRNVLNRLREAAGELVVRDGDSLVLQAGEIDAQLFTAAAADALSATDAVASSDRARAALALYGGELLPDDRYEEWVTEPRERLRGRALALLDLLAGNAAREGDVDEALRLLAQAIEADRLDESRYLRAAELYLRQGKRGRALDTLRAAAGALRELDLVPSAAHRELVRSARS
ncbi:MAG: BTAD domain-containing putative transcriptional regulator, partial [Gaiella sp.]